MIPILEGQGFNVVAAQIPLTSLIEDIAVTRRLPGEAEHCRCSPPDRGRCAPSTPWSDPDSYRPALIQDFACISVRAPLTPSVIVCKGIRAVAASIAHEMFGSARSQANSTITSETRSRPAVCSDL
jgi:hypothetical protein